MLVTFNTFFIRIKALSVHEVRLIFHLLLVPLCYLSGRQSLFVPLQTPGLLSALVQHAETWNLSDFEYLYIVYLHVNAKVDTKGSMMLLASSSVCGRVVKFSTSLA